MIVSANRSGVLELFWRHRVRTALFRLAPSDFLSSRTRKADVDYMRGWLSIQPGCASLRTLDDSKVIQRIRDAVRSGEIVLAEPPAGPRLPGTGIAIASVYGPMLLLAYRKLWHAADLAYALELMPMLSDDELNSLRAILTDNDHWGTRVMDKTLDVRSEVAGLLKAGELIPNFTYYPNNTYEEVPELPAFEPPEIKRVSEPEDVIEASTFGSDHSAQAEAMISAAASGIPFCEVCNKLR